MPTEDLGVYTCRSAKLGHISLSTVYKPQMPNLLIKIVHTSAGTIFLSPISLINLGTPLTKTTCNLRVQIITPLFCDTLTNSLNVLSVEVEIAWLV